MKKINIIINMFKGIKRELYYVVSDFNGMNGSVYRKINALTMGIKESNYDAMINYCEIDKANNLS